MGGGDLSDDGDVNDALTVTFGNSHHVLLEFLLMGMMLKTTLQASLTVLKFEDIMEAVFHGMIMGCTGR